MAAFSPAQVLGAQRAWRSWDAVHIAEALLAPLQTAAVAAVGADVGRLLAPVDVETAAGVPLPEARAQAWRRAGGRVRVICRGSFVKKGRPMASLGQALLLQLQKAFAWRKGFTMFIDSMHS